MALASSPAAAPPMPSATMKSEPRGPTSWRRTSGCRLAFPVLRSATRKVSSLCSRVRPRSVLPKTDTWTGSVTRAVPSDDPFGDVESVTNLGRPGGASTSACRKSQSTCTLQPWCLVRGPRWPRVSRCGSRAGGVRGSRPPVPVARRPDSRPSRLRPSPRAARRCRRCAGPLALQVVYPPPDAVLQIRDSSFLFGTAGTWRRQGDDRRQPARVWPNGAWLAYVALPPDSVMQLRIEARTGLGLGGRSTTRCAASCPMRAASPSAPPGWTRCRSRPSGRLWLGQGEYLTLGVRAAEGAQVRLRLSDGTSSRSTPQPGSPRGCRRACARSTAIRRDSGRRSSATAIVGLLRGRAVGPDPGPTCCRCPFALVSRSTRRGPRSRRSSERIRRAHAGRCRSRCSTACRWSPSSTTTRRRARCPDSMTVGRAVPGGTYAWFFPSGTRAAVTGRRNGDLRLRLSRDAEAWVPVGRGASRSRAGGPAPSAVVGSVTVTPSRDRATVRIPLSQRVPFRCRGDRSLAGRHVLRRRRATWTGCATVPPIRWSAG